ncbi:MAG: carboxy-S-adenosyl-L-methionine synthase CmoA [Succinivibrionaceae bacterium]|nr:carboxy-S-adenosyl-L-methionine synthase CmoA [Succinivibrionaceae bacterium]
MKDSLFAAPRETNTPFVFDENVAEVFPDMARRSIPGYETIIETIGRLAAAYAREGTRIYDLGCSLGEASVAARRCVRSPNVALVAVDNSEAMVRRCRSVLSSYRSEVPAEVVLGDIASVPVENASVVILNFVLQFIARDRRLGVLKKIHDGLCPGGILILSEKMCNADPLMEDLLTGQYFDFKRKNGYSELEISQKRSALEDVLVPDTWEEIRDRLRQAGFVHADRWFQTYNFCSIVAIKEGRQQ